MEFNFENLDEQTRSAMILEVKTDIDRKVIYYSKRFTKYGRIKYLALLLDAVKSGNEQTLANSIKSNYCFVETEKREGKNGVIQANIPKNANLVFAESEFNRFYIRALAKIAISSNRGLTIYRARESKTVRPASERLIGKTVDPVNLLYDLRNNIGVDTAFGLPVGPNSGLSVRLS
jgi:hypothetical protein